VTVLLDTAFRRGVGLILGEDRVVEVKLGGDTHLFLKLPRYMTKNDKPRMVPCTARVEALLPALRSQAVAGRWFPLDNVAWYMWDNVRADVKAMGGNIDDVGLHTLRHTCLTRLALGGMELQRLSMWAGHSDVSITAKRYSHLNATALLGGVSLLGTVGGNTGKRDGNVELPVHSNASIADAKRASLGTVTMQ
jgi:integrase